MKPPQPIRREVEGECGICLCDLHRSQDENSDEEKTESGGGDDHDDSDDSDDGDDSDDENDYDDSDDDTDADDDDTDDHGHLEELVWCRARCGVNFHKQCIDQWLETDHASTCPTCRSNWKH
jgi:RING-finger-containing ubiquitin ligase